MCYNNFMNTIEENAQQIRNVIRYLSKFKNGTVVIYIDDAILDSPLLTSHIHDIAFLHKAGLKIVLVPGARKHIDAELKNAGIKSEFKDGNRITTSDAIPVIKNAAFDVSNTIMTSLAGEKLSALIGNWVHARGKGVINGVDFGSCGEIDKLDSDSIRKVLDDGFIPIFPCIGWSINGKPYNISSITLATQIAVALKSEKLFFMIPDAEIGSKTFSVPKEIGLSPEGIIPALKLDEVDLFLEENESVASGKSSENALTKNQILNLLILSKNACKAGVSRCHILDSNLCGTLPCEIFSNLGCGTMIYSENYGNIRAMERDDIPGLLTLIAPFVQKSILLPRSKEQLELSFQDYIVYEIDGAIRGCAALHIYEKQAEIACVAVDESCANIGIGPKIIEKLIEKAESLKMESVFVLTTQTSDWFEKQGFVAADISTLPEKRKAMWNPNRGSKMFVKNL